MEIFFGNYLHDLEEWVLNTIITVKNQKPAMRRLWFASFLKVYIEMCNV